MNLIIPLSINIIISIITGLAFLIFGMIVYLDAKSKKNNKLFFLMTMAAIFWITVVTIRFSVDSKEIIILSARMSYVAAALLAFFINIFSYNFPIKNFYRYPIKISIISTLIIIYLSIFTSGVIKTIDISAEGSQSNVFGNYLYIYVIFFLVLAIFSLYNLISKLKRLEAQETKQTYFIIFGLSISLIIGSLTNLILPPILHSTFTEQFGPIATMFFIVMAAYSILKHHLFNIKLIATEIFTGILWIFATIRVITSPNIEKVIQNSVLFIAVFFIGILLIKSANKLVEQREKAENLAEDLKYANEQLRKINEREKEFLSFASHQLKSPLSSIKGYTSLIIEGTFGEISGDVKDAIRKMFVSANSMNRSVNDFLNVSRIEQGRLEYKITTFDFLDLVKSITTGITTKILKNNINFVSNFDDCGSVCMIEADKEKTEQIIGNVINGIIQYSNNKEVEDIHLDIFKNENCAILSIKSLNMNISQEKLFGLFQKYSEEIEESENDGQKIGLGFYVAKEMMMRQNGKLDAQVSENSNEVTFSLEFPLA